MKSRLSLIIILNEESVFDQQKAGSQLAAICGFLYSSNPSNDVILIIDKQDSKIQEIASNAECPNLKIINLPFNHNLKEMLSQGLHASTNNLICLMENLLPIKLQQLELLTQLITLSHADIVLASRLHPLSQLKTNNSFRVKAWVSQQLLRIFFNRSYSDPTFSLKIMKRDVLTSVLPQLSIASAYNLEMLIIAEHLGYSHIIEAPIFLNKSYENNLQLNLGSILRIFINKNIAHQYQKAKTSHKRSQPQSTTNALSQHILKKKVVINSKLQGVIYNADSNKTK